MLLQSRRQTTKKALPEFERWLDHVLSISTPADVIINSKTLWMRDPRSISREEFHQALFKHCEDVNLSLVGWEYLGMTVPREAILQRLARLWELSS